MVHSVAGEAAVYRRERVLPSPLAFFIWRCSQAECVEVLGDSVLLLVRIEDPSSDLARGLAESSPLHGDRMYPTVDAEGTGTRKKMMGAADYRPPSTRHVLTPEALAAILDE